VRDEADLRQFHVWWDGVFDFFARRGVEPCSIGDIEEAAQASREGLAPTHALG